MFSLAKQMAPLERVVDIMDPVKDPEKFKKDFQTLQACFNEFLEDLEKESETDKALDNYRRELAELFSPSKTIVKE